MGGACNKTKPARQASTRRADGPFLAPMASQILPEPAPAATVYLKWKGDMVCTDEFFLHQP
jgi:hypothetical protein